ncbi:HAAS signaling domain-containing protein [Bacillus thuringiensis]|uniref:HAAS signaling domain-containing protein n=1 Tax=Bacillus thuringiensis TaxID=1428 RepID=UPI0031451663
MNKEQFFSNELIISFLHDFHKGLMNLPTSAREQHVLEIKSDLYENALSKESERIPPANIPSQVIAEFLPPKELAKEIAAEYTDVIEEAQQSTNTFIKYFTGFSIAPLGALSIPIVLGFINISACLPFLLAFIASNIWFICRENHWNTSQLKFLKTVISFSTSVLIALPFGFFAIRIMITKQFDMFSFYYLIGYVLFSSIYIVLLKQLYKKNKQYQPIDAF